MRRKFSDAHGGTPEEIAMGRTLAEKVWDSHVVRRADGEPDLLAYVARAY